MRSDRSQGTVFWGVERRGETDPAPCFVRHRMSRGETMEQFERRYASSGACTAKHAGALRRHRGLDRNTAENRLLRNSVNSKVVLRVLYHWGHRAEASLLGRYQSYSGSQKQPTGDGQRSPVHIASLVAVLDAVHAVFPVLLAPHRRLVAVLAVGRRLRAVLDLAVVAPTITWPSHAAHRGGELRIGSQVRTTARLHPP